MDSEMFTHASAFLKVADVSARLRIKTDTVLQLIRVGQLAAVNVASPGCTRPRWRVSPLELQNFLASRAAPKPIPRSARRRTKEAVGFVKYF